MFKSRKEKVFCIGFNKTGTTSLERTLKEHSFKLGEQRSGELLFDDWVKRDFRKIIKLAKTADAFQDIPFSLPYTFIALDQHFPNARFILSVRSSSEEWYESIVRFHSKLWGDGSGNLLSSDELKNASYLYPGAPYHFIKHIYNTTDQNIYEKQKLISIYENHNISVLDYFRFKPEKLLVVNLSDPDSYNKFCSFLGISPLLTSFPILNASK